MLKTSAAEGARKPPRVSLRRNFTWTFAGNVLFGVSQWAVLSLIAKLGSVEMLGQYAFALALTTPVSMLSHLNLRAVLATDMERRHSFGDYLAVRVASTVLALAVFAVMAVIAGNSAELAAVIVLLGISLGADNISDACYGAFQRDERMSVIARSMIARGLFSLGALAMALRVTGKLPLAVAALAAGRAFVLLLHDLPLASRGQELERSGAAAQWAIFRTALPLGLVLMLVSFASNVPRYAVEAFLGARELGVFAAVAVFLNAGSTVANALGQTATPRLARHYSEREVTAFRRLTATLTGLTVLVGVAGVLFAAVAGQGFLRLAYSAEYAANAGLMVVLMGAGVLVYLAVLLGYVITSARSFLVQLPLLILVASAAAAANWLLVPSMGLTGAAVSIALAAGLQIGGQLLILHRTLRRAEAV